MVEAIGLQFINKIKLIQKNIDYFFLFPLYIILDSFLMEIR